MQDFDENRQEISHVRQNKRYLSGITRAGPCETHSSYCLRGNVRASAWPFMLASPGTGFAFGALFVEVSVGQDADQSSGSWRRKVLATSQMLLLFSSSSCRATIRRLMAAYLTKSTARSLPQY